MTTAWFDEQNRMTPEELQTVTFPLSRLGRRGYEEEAVQEFLKAVHAELVHLVNERTSLWQEVQRLRRRVIDGNLDGADPQAVLFGGQDAHVHAVRILSAAQLTADRYVSDAQTYSSRLTEEAKLRRDEIMTSAQQHSDMILAEAHAKAREAAVSALDGTTTTTTPSQSDQARRGAQAELAYLRTYCDVYRAHLRAYTEGVLRGIEDWERKEAASLQEAARATPIARAPSIDGNPYLHH